jgi:hypothetical protein
MLPFFVQLVTYFIIAIISTSLYITLSFCFPEIPSFFKNLNHSFRNYCYIPVIFFIYFRNINIMQLLLFLLTPSIRQQQSKRRSVFMTTQATGSKGNTPISQREAQSRLAPKSAIRSYQPATAIQTVAYGKPLEPGPIRTVSR